VLSAADVRRALPMRPAIDSQREAFITLATGQAEVPQRTPISVPEEKATVLFMPARSASHVGAKIVSIFPNNPASDLPLIQGVLLLVDAGTGEPLALMDATYLTALRTGAATAVATDLLAQPAAKSAAIIGTGAQAVMQLLAICAVRPLEWVWVYSRTADHVASFIGEMQPEIKPTIMPAATAAEAVRDADIVCTATTSATPVFDGHHLKAGSHVNGIGSYTPQQREIDSETVRRAKCVFVESRPAALAEAGDVLKPLEEGVLRKADIIELGAVAIGQHPGRSAADQITFFKSVGSAAQDLAAAGAVLRRAREMQLGVDVEL
jgi:ornithine cyclodeaminase